MKQAPILITVVAVCLTLSSTSTYAQTSSEAVYTSPDNVFSFQYPQTFALEVHDGRPFLGNRGIVTWETPTRTSEIRLQVLPPAWVANYILTDAFLPALISQHPESAMKVYTTNLSETYQEELTPIGRNAVTMGNITVGDHEGYIRTMDLRDNEQLTLVTLDIGESVFASINAVTLAREWALFEPLVFDIAASMRFDPSQTLAPSIQVLSDHFTHDDLSFDYPSQWDVLEIFNGSGTTVVMTNTRWALIDLLRQPVPSRPGRFLAGLMEPYDLSILSSTLDNPSLTGILSALEQTGPGGAGEPEEFVLNGKRGAILHGQVPPPADVRLGYFVLIIELRPQTYAAFSVTSQLENLEFLEQMFIEIADTFQYSDS